MTEFPFHLPAISADHSVLARGNQFPKLLILAAHVHPIFPGTAVVRLERNGIAGAQSGKSTGQTTRNVTSALDGSLDAGADASGDLGTVHDTTQQTVNKKKQTTDAAAKKPEKAAKKAKHKTKEVASETAAETKATLIPRRPPRPAPLRTRTSTLRTRLQPMEVSTPERYRRVQTLRRTPMQS